jgi:hypothetical protein
MAAYAKIAGALRAPPGRMHLGGALTTDQVGRLHVRFWGAPMRGFATKMGAKGAGIAN